MSSNRSSDHLFHDLHPRKLIPELCRHFYTQGWFSGTGGGISIKQGPNIYVAPSGVQKERLEPNDLFVLKQDGNVAQSPPPEKNLKLSQCTPLFMNAYTDREAEAVMHSHGKFIVLASMIYERSEFRIRNLEMIKGIYNPVEKRMLRYDEELVVPIIENTCFEADLKDSMREAMKKYPESNAVIVRNHGIYVWGQSWEQCKTMAECYHYLCEMAVEMERLGINPYTHGDLPSSAPIMNPSQNEVSVKMETNEPVPEPNSSETKAKTDTNTDTEGVSTNKPEANTSKATAKSEPTQNPSKNSKILNKKNSKNLAKRPMKNQTMVGGNKRGSGFVNHRNNWNPGVQMNPMFHPAFGQPRGRGGRLQVPYSQTRKQQGTKKNNKSDKIAQSVLMNY